MEIPEGINRELAFW